MRKKWQCVVLAGLSLAPAIAWKSSSEPKPSVTGMFSDMRYIESEDDYVGTEVFIVMGAEADERRYFAIVQFAEGAPRPPQLVDVTIHEDRVGFPARHPTAGSVQFVGRVSDGKLVGRFKGLQGEVTLPRRPSVWQQ